jgi:outer membrane protein OmpA-like peptidoglycan-associated protein
MITPVHPDRKEPKMRSLSALLLLFVAVPAPALACNFATGEVHEVNLYYELGSATLGAAGDSTVQMTATTFTGCKVLIIASGHIDASEVATSPSLGQARADDARQRLQAQGVPARTILVRDMKHDSPAVQTAANERSPLNRRVELVIVIR